MAHQIFCLHIQTLLLLLLVLGRCILEISILLLADTLARCCDTAKAAAACTFWILDFIINVGKRKRGGDVPGMNNVLYLQLILGKFWRQILHCRHKCMGCWGKLCTIGTKGKIRTTSWVVLPRNILILAFEVITCKVFLSSHLFLKHKCNKEYMTIFKS